MQAIDVMVRDVVTVHPFAGLFERRRIKRVAIVRAGKVVGVVSQANLIQALASAVGVSRAQTIPTGASATKFWYG